MTWLRKGKEGEPEVPNPVSVNENLSRLSSEDLDALAESSLMAAAESMSRINLTSGVDKIFHLDRAVTYSFQAYQALVIIQTRLSS